jgi:acetyl esterase/lipase
MRLATALILLLFCVFNISCSHPAGNTLKNIVAERQLPFSTYKNVHYAADDSAAQTMDIYIPANANGNTTGIVLFIHGGGWVAGNKDDFNGLGLDTLLAGSNMAMATINYRLAGAYPYPACLDDIGYALDHLAANAEKYHINPNRICLFGRSSGGHLALQYAYTRNSAGRIKAVVDMFGPTDLTADDIVNGVLAQDVTTLLGPYAANAAAWHDASPIYHLAGAVPTVIMHGTTDSVVYTTQSTKLEDSLIVRGVPTSFIPWTGNGHGWNTARWNESKDITVGFVAYYIGR